MREYGATLPDGWKALYLAHAGVVFSERARHTFLEAAGVEVETNRRIESTDELDADVVVVTAGPWTRELVPDLPVTVTRETLAYFAREGPPGPSLVDLNEQDENPRDVLAPRSGVRAEGRRASRGRGSRSRDGGRA